MLFAQFPLGRASFNTQLFAEVWRLTNSGMWDHYCQHIDTYMYRVSSAEFLPHSIAHKLAGMSLVLVMSYVKICCPLAKTLCLDCIACNKKNLQILRKLLIVEPTGRAGRKFYPPLDSGCQTPEHLCICVWNKNASVGKALPLQPAPRPFTF